MAEEEERAEELEALQAIYGDDVAYIPADSSSPTSAASHPSTATGNGEGHNASAHTDCGSEGTVRVRCGPEKRHTLEATLPRGYPRLAPKVFVSVDTGVIESQRCTDALHSHLAQTPHPETPVLFELVSWVDEWAAAHATPASPASDASQSSSAVGKPDAPCVTKGNLGVPGAHSSGSGENAVTAEGAAVGHGAEAAAAPLDRQWIWFIGFYTRSIIKAFCAAAADLGCTGFLMPGKPAVSAVEGTAEAIAEFLRVTRTELFAKVPPASRKMKLCLVDRGISQRVFEGFEEVELRAGAGAHKRKDIADLGGLEAFLAERGLSHAFNEIFDSAVR